MLVLPEHIPHPRLSYLKAHLILFIVRIQLRQRTSKSWAQIPCIKVPTFITPSTLMQ